MRYYVSSFTMGDDLSNNADFNNNNNNNYNYNYNKNNNNNTNNNNNNKNNNADINNEDSHKQKAEQARANEIIKQLLKKKNEVKKHGPLEIKLEQITYDKTRDKIGEGSFGTVYAGNDLLFIFILV